MLDLSSKAVGTENAQPLADVERVLVIDDERLVLTTLQRVLTRAGCKHVEGAQSGEEALELLARAHYQVVLLDVQFDGDWRKILAATLSLGPPTAVLMMSGAADLRTAIEAMRRGATDFLEKPIAPDELLARVEQALVHTAMRRRLNLFETQQRTRVESTSAAMEQPLRLADLVAETPMSSALIVGESGVGKEVLAARIHEKSSRRGGPFIRVNLAAIAESMVEAELFGSVRGAFTDARRDRAGYLATADGGTILLDEIGEFRLELQAKLLRAIEERRFFPVGSDRERCVNVRFLAATNRSPDDLLASKSLRPDLFYRLGTVIRVPPLRERASEVGSLAEEFVAMFCREFGRPLYAIAPESLAALAAHRWPGNIRELRNVIEHAVMTCDGTTIMPIHLGLSAPRESKPGSLHLAATRDQSVDQVEREHILRVLDIAGDSRSRAATLLGVSRSTLYEKLKRYGIG